MARERCSGRDMPVVGKRLMEKKGYACVREDIQGMARGREMMGAWRCSRHGRCSGKCPRHASSSGSCLQPGAYQCSPRQLEFGMLPWLLSLQGSSSSELPRSTLPGTEISCFAFAPRRGRAGVGGWGPWGGMGWGWFSVPGPKIPPGYPTGGAGNDGGSRTILT